MTLPKLETAARVGDQAFDALHAAISNGDYPAGRRLQIRNVAHELGISVMPVREAIKRLEEMGLVETQPYRGAVVKDFTPTELLHIYAVRRVLEVEAAAQGTKNLTREDFQRLDDLYAGLRRAVEDNQVIDYLDQDEMVLTTVYSAAGNPVLIEMIRTLWGRCRHYKIVGARDELDLGNAVHLLEHQERLIQAVKLGDSAAAARITAESIDAASARIRQALPRNR